MLGLRDGQPGARHWRRTWSDAALRMHEPAEVSRRANAAPTPVTPRSCIQP
jgi:tRNA-dihydrouridine synthase A